MPAIPRVSVLIPSYNHARFLPEALDSVLSQTYQDFEIIIVDDGSTDGSLSIAEGYASKHPGIFRIASHPERSHRGISATINLCFQMMRGEYFASVPSDDLWYADKLEEQVACLDSNPLVGVVYGYAEVIDEEGRLLDELRDIVDISLEPDPVSRLIQGNVISGGTCMGRRSCVEQAGLFDETLTYGDWEFWIRILAHWKIAFINRPLAKYRHHQYNTSVGATKKVHLERAVEVLTSLRGKAASTGGTLALPRTQALIELQLSFLYFCLGDCDFAAPMLASAFTTDPELVSDLSYFDRWFTARSLEGAWIQDFGGVDRNLRDWLRKELRGAAGDCFADSFELLNRLRDEQYATQMELESLRNSRAGRLVSGYRRLKKRAGL